MFVLDSVSLTIHLPHERKPTARVSDLVVKIGLVKAQHGHGRANQPLKYQGHFFNPGNLTVRP